MVRWASTLSLDASQETSSVGPMSSREQARTATIQIKLSRWPYTRSAVLAKVTTVVWILIKPGAVGLNSSLQSWHRSETAPLWGGGLMLMPSRCSMWSRYWQLNPAVSPQRWRVHTRLNCAWSMLLADWEARRRRQARIAELTVFVALQPTTNYFLLPLTFGFTIISILNVCSPTTLLIASRLTHKLLVLKILQ